MSFESEKSIINAYLKATITLEKDGMRHGYTIF